MTERNDDHDVGRPASQFPARLDTRLLFANGQNEIRIEHEGVEYRLRITKSNKLILFR